MSVNARLGLFLLVGVLLFPSRLLAAPGDLDTTFGTGGIAVIDFGGSETAVSAALDSQNRIVLVGSKNGDILVARIKKSGAVDTSFGNDYNGDGILDGYTLIDHGFSEYGSKVLIDSLDRIYIVGTTYEFGYATSIVARLLADGTPDTTFAWWWSLTGYNYQCIYTTGISGALDASGNLYTFGTVAVPGSVSGGSYSAMDPDGNIWHSSCAEIHPSGFASADKGSAGVTIQSDGKPLYAGSTGNDLYIARGQALSQNLDLGYGTNGNGMTIVSHLAIGSAQPQNVLQAWDSAIDTNPASAHYDKPVVVGNVDTNILVMRFDTAGAFDATFNAGAGYRDIDFGGVEYGRAIAYDNNGRIVVAGESDGGSIAVARVKKNGNLDTGFGPNGDGKLLTNPALGVVSVFDLVINSQGKILVVAGAYNRSDILLVRYLGGN
jgi:uncharacterized delta-60 repeat protein